MSSEIVAESGVAGMTAGTLLRQAREDAGVHIAALAVALKVPVGKLEALESDNYAVLPDTVFVRALASSVCRTLKVDAAPILAALPQSQSPRLATDSAGLNARVREHGSRSPSSPLGGSTPRSVVLVVLVLLIGALVVVFLPRQQNAAPGAVEPVAVAPAPVAETPAAAAADAAPVSALAPVAAPVTPVAADAAVAAVAPAAVAAPAVAVAAAAAAPAASTPAPVAAVAGSELLVLRARGGESWIQVRDAAGTVALQRNLAAGETVALPGPGPLSVVVGRADVTEVSVRGKPFDLAAVTRVNVARFEVK